MNLTPARFAAGGINASRAIIKAAGARHRAV
jgi:hypothetical protein